MPVQEIDDGVEPRTLHAPDHAAGLAAIVILGDDFPQMLFHHGAISTSGNRTAKAASNRPI
jgi:hypothetical protein